ncbi:MAG: LapA family protein [Hyphomicrobiaceae bacterium]|nr:LapA family protein [Hyphomicrobiaceae bacterium]
MLRRIAWILIAFPAAIVLVTLAIANRHTVQLVLDPFRPDAPALSLVLPLYAYLFAALVAGVVLGGVATWVTQRHWRRDARVKTHEARRWHAEADRLTRERDSDTPTSSKQLVPAGH